jgi:bifunctional non-homologous end joining protein LigD
MGLREYKKKRSPKTTPEPFSSSKKKSSLIFVVQKHEASHLHYDVRLEVDGVLKSWAVPKGPSLNPKDKRLAVMVEDHPYDYHSFEGVIPEGNYGAGIVMVWDTGHYYPVDENDEIVGEKAVAQGLKKGKVRFVLEGEKLRGLFSLIREITGC